MLLDAKRVSSKESLPRITTPQKHVKLPFIREFFISTHGKHMPTPFLTVLVGPIASGKSTLSRELAKQGSIIISDDAIVDMLHGGDNTLYNRNLKPLYKSVEMQIACNAISCGLNVVIDRPNMSRSSRARWVTLARSLDVYPEAIVMPMEDDPVIHANRRFTSDSRGWELEKWIKVANRQFAEYEPINLYDECFSCWRNHGE